MLSKLSIIELAPIVFTNYIFKKIVLFKKALNTLFCNRINSQNSKTWMLVKK